MTAIPARGRFYSWLVGVVLAGTVIVVATQLSEGREFLKLAEAVAPAWLAFGLLLQLTTYLVDARSWQQVLRRAGEPRPLRGFIALGLTKLFVDQAVPSGGISGTLVVVRGLERRGIPRPMSMAAVVVDLYAYYASYAAALVAALVVLAVRAELGAAVLVTVGAFGIMALSVVGLLTALTTSLRRFLPRRLLRLRFIAPLAEAVAEADPRLVRRADLLATSFAHQLAILLLDAATVWAMLRGIGVELHPVNVFASFMLSTLARTLGILPGGIGTFEAVSVATLRMVGAPLAAALTATLLFRGLSFWIPLVPGMLVARRESAAGAP